MYQLMYFIQGEAKQVLFSCSELCQNADWSLAKWTSVHVRWVHTC